MVEVEGMCGGLRAGTGTRAEAGVGGVRGGIGAGRAGGCSMRVS